MLLLDLFLLLLPVDAERRVAEEVVERFGRELVLGEDVAEADIVAAAVVAHLLHEHVGGRRGEGTLIVVLPAGVELRFGVMLAQVALPHYPGAPFASLDAARAWVADFVAWYNGEHLHSGIGFVTPNTRQAGRAEQVLRARRAVYERARRRRPERWARSTRRWDAPQVVRLHPEREPPEASAA